MSMNKNIARLAVTAGLTAALSFGGVMAPVTMAFAADATTSTNSIKINKNNANGDVKYKAYQIFEADVVDETGKTDKVVSNVKWATGINDTTRTAIIDAVKAATKAIAFLRILLLRTLPIGCLPILMGPRKKRFSRTLICSIRLLGWLRKKSLRALRRILRMLRLQQAPRFLSANPVITCF